jgi:hypothetical protein
MRYRSVVHSLGAAVLAVVIIQVSLAAHASYVMEAEGVSLSADAQDLMRSGVTFELVHRNAENDSREAIQAALTNLSNVAGMRGNLLQGPLVQIPDVAGENTDLESVSLTLQVTPPERHTSFGNIDFSYYDVGIGDASSMPTSLDGVVSIEGSELGRSPVEMGVLQAGAQTLPMLDTSSIFWILKPVEFESYSQMIAARFGF